MSAVAAAERKIVLLTRRTRLEELIRRHNTATQARFWVEARRADFADYLAEHDAYRRARDVVEAALAPLGRLQMLDRDFLPNFLFGPDDTVVALGQDGLVANALKYLEGQPLVGVNPERTRWDGVLVPFAPDDLTQLIPEVLAGRRATRAVTMARAELGDGQTLHAVNDLFVGARSHVSARYALAWDGRREVQSSSGVIVSTGLGSTGWLKSVLAGAFAIARAHGLAAAQPPPDAMPWDAGELRFSVREPFPSRSSGAELVYGRITAERRLVVESRMAEGGVIFSDGVEQDFLAFDSGAIATIGIAERRGRLVV